MPLSRKRAHHLVENRDGDLAELYGSPPAAAQDFPGSWEQGVNAVQCGLFVAVLGWQGLGDDPGQHFDVQFPGRILVLIAEIDV